MSSNYYDDPNSPNKRQQPQDPYAPSSQQSQGQDQGNMSQSQVMNALPSMLLGASGGIAGAQQKPGGSSGGGGLPLPGK